MDVDAHRDLTHLDSEGRAKMVDVTPKPVSAREALAQGTIAMSQEAFAAVRDGTGPKGDVLSVARLAGIMAGKRTGELIPLCHVLPSVSVSVELELDESVPGVTARARAAVADRTGVEMEALVAVSTALLTVYDMVKAVDRGMVIREVRLISKAGGKSGAWTSSDT
jgi:cyclic pyranopterin phosphate synthase